MAILLTNVVQFEIKVDFGDEMHGTLLQVEPNNLVGIGIFITDSSLLKSRSNLQRDQTKQDLTKSFTMIGFLTDPALAAGTRGPSS